MRIRQLEWFNRVCETGSITRAAALLNIAQPALGKQISALEREFGVSLLKRGPLGTKPTPAGEVLLEEGNEILLRLQKLKRKLNSLSRSCKAPLRLGLPPTLMKVMARDLLREPSLQREGITIQLSEEHPHVLIDHVESGRLDAAFAYNAPSDRAIVCSCLLSEPIYIIAASGTKFDNIRSIAMADLEDVGLAMPSRQSLVRMHIENAMRERGLVLRVTYEADSIQAIRDLILSGMAFGILPRYAFVDEIKAGAVVALKVINPVVMRSLSLVTSENFDDLFKSSIFDVLASFACKVETLNASIERFGSSLPREGNVCAF
jgi:LysR family transcriptional regulator, nitrogen assimilation regulatory protein